MKRTSIIFLFACVATVVCSLGTAFAAANGTVPVPDFPVGKRSTFLRQCDSLAAQKQYGCYGRGLLSAVVCSHDPAHELPRIDDRVRGGGGYLATNCHILMHEVGRTWARRHRLTLETLYRYVPRTNDPGCSAGFGMGMVMYLGTKLVLEPRATIPICTGLPTRFREYTCFHGSGHAFMRGYHGRLDAAMQACTSLGARFTPDCAQGAFHDYWISLSGGDGTQRPKDADADPRSVCARYAYPRPCWYRFFWERRQSARVDNGADVLRLCTGLTGLQRAGCIGGASLMLVRVAEPIDHALICGRLSAPDSFNCLHGVDVPALKRDPYAQVRLVRTCSTQPASTRTDCYRWFGRTLNVVNDGRFERWGCSQLRLPDVRAACIAGARRIDQPLATFS